MLRYTLAFSLVATTFVYVYFKHAYTYWKKLGVPFFDPIFPFGNCLRIVTRNQTIGEFLTDLYNETKSHGFKHLGLYFLHKPIYFPIDPDLIKNILVKDFQYFHDRGVYSNPEKDPFSGHLFAQVGKKWKRLRARFGRVFTIRKLKREVKSFVRFSKDLVEAVQGCTVIDVTDVMERYNCDVTASYVFGVTCNNSARNNFLKFGRQLFSPPLFYRLKLFLCTVFPDFFHLLNLSITNPKLSQFFKKVLQDVIQFPTNNFFVQLLTSMISDQTISGFDDASAHAFLFFAAGYETASKLAAFCLFELAQNEEIQRKVREEVVQVLVHHCNEITYETLGDMKYLDRVLEETLRKYPPISFLQRIVTKRYKIPNTDIILDEGTLVFIPVYALHQDLEYFPDPGRFDPERFNQSSNCKSTYIPFGKGPRSCIGERFGLFQTKVVLSAFVLNYKFSLNPKVRLPIVFDARSFVLRAKEKIWINIKKL